MTQSQLIMHGLMPASDWKPPRLEDLPQRWDGIPRVSFDAETKDPDLPDLGCGARRPGCHVAGWAVAFDFGRGPGDYKSYYLPVRHEDGGNLPLEPVVRYLDDMFRDYRGRVVGLECSYDGDFSMQEGVRFHPLTSWYDVANTDSLIDEYQDGYTLEKVATRNGLVGKDESLLRAAASFYEGGAKNPKRVLHRMHSKYVGPYAEWDGELPLRIDDAQRPKVRDLGLDRAVDLEAAFLPITVHMRRRGIRVDVPGIERVERWTNESQHARLAQFHHLTGIQVSIDDTRSSSAMDALVKRLGLPPLPTIRYNKKKREWLEGAPVIDAETLSKYRHPGLNLLVEAKRLDTILTTYIPQMHKHVLNGRIHGTLKSVRGSRDGSSGSDDQRAGTISRRCSHVHPNLGNQPNPHSDDDDLLWVEVGTVWRGLFIPDDPDTQDWGLADQSQQEPTRITHYAELLGLPGADKMAHLFRTDPKVKAHRAFAEMTGLPYGLAKICYLSKAYGAGKANQAGQLEAKYVELHPELPPGWSATVEKVYRPGDWLPNGKCVGDTYKWPVPEILEILDRMDKYAPYVKELSNICRDQAKKNGLIKLMDGGLAHFEVNPWTHEYKDTHKGLNKLAQGDSAIQLKLWLVELWRRGVLMQMTVHDDVSKSVDKGEAGTRELLLIKEVGESVIKYVPPDEGLPHPQRLATHKADPYPYKSLVPHRVNIKRGPSYGAADSATAISV